MEAFCLQEGGPDCSLSQYCGNGVCVSRFGIDPITDCTLPPEEYSVGSPWFCPSVEDGQVVYLNDMTYNSATGNCECVKQNEIRFGRRCLDLTGFQETGIFGAYTGIMYNA